MGYTRSQFGNKDLSYIYEGVTLAINSKLSYEPFTAVSMTLLIAQIEIYRAANPTKVQVLMCVTVTAGTYEALVTYSSNSN